MPPYSGWAYRPFESTDADVTEPGQIEIELGDLWGLIVELPVTSTVRIVTEWNGEHDGAADTLALLGAIWEPPQGSVALDVGLRRGISNTANDWAVNLGLTVNF